MEEGAEARDLVGEKGVKSGRLPLADGAKDGATNKAAKVHGWVEIRPFTKGQNGLEGGREGGGWCDDLLLRIGGDMGWRKGTKVRVSQ